MQGATYVSRNKRRLFVLLAVLAMSGCANHCGYLNYCDISEGWPLTDTFSVVSNNNRLCVGGARRSSCASKGVYQSGTRFVEVYSLSEEGDETESDHITLLRVVGMPGDAFTVSCYQYNGKRVFGLTEVLVGVEIRDRLGAVVAEFPKHQVVRRSSIFPGC